MTARDRAADGAFVYAVRTTGIYCRPSCGARLPRRENVEFHASAAAARQAGFRPCRRCRPDQPPSLPAAELAILGLCRAIDEAGGPAAVRAVARRAGMSAFHLQRRFKALTGLTPTAYANGRRVERLRRALRRETSVTAAVYGAGYDSAATAYRQAGRWLGMTPAAYRAGGAEVRMAFVTRPCSLGWLLVAATERGVCCVLLGDDPGTLIAELARRFPRAARAEGGSGMEQLVATVLGLVENPAAPAVLPLDVRGTVFQLRVWQSLMAIPAGQTISYAQLAAAVGVPNGARAVARACASNHVAVAIPCHRVVRGDGDLSGYRWGVARKRALLERERAGKP